MMFTAEDGIRDIVRSGGLGDGYKRRVVRVAIVKSPGSTVPGSATTTRSPTAKLVAPQTMSRGPGSPTSTLTALMGFLNSASSRLFYTSDAADDPTRYRPDAHPVSPDHTHNHLPSTQLVHLFH